jgi:hypothetical protein
MGSMMHIEMWIQLLLIVLIDADQPVDTAGLLSETLIADRDGNIRVVECDCLHPQGSDAGSSDEVG